MFGSNSWSYMGYTSSHTHTHTYIYIYALYIYICIYNLCICTHVKHGMHSYILCFMCLYHVCFQFGFSGVKSAMIIKHACSNLRNAGSFGEMPQQVVNSMTHPAAWAFMDRAVKRQIVPQEALNEWQAGGTTRNKLFKSFVHKVYLPGADQTSNVLRLEAFIKIRQASRDWRSTLQGYEWLTETEMQDDKKWNETFVFNICVSILRFCFQSCLGFIRYVFKRKRNLHGLKYIYIYNL